MQDGMGYFLAAAWACPFLFFHGRRLLLVGDGGTASFHGQSAGRSIMEATIEAGEQRLRPIIMTSLAFAFGVLPLAIAMGAGANARHSIGTGIIGGMIGETTLAMLYVPLLFYLFDRFAERSEAGWMTAATAPDAADAQDQTEVQ